MADSLPSTTQTPEPIIQLEKYIIRQFCESDAESIAKGANNHKIAKWMLNRFPHPYTVENARDWIKTATSASPVICFGICERDTNTVIGTIGGQRREDVNHRTMIVGYWVSEEHWGKGIATEVLVAYCRWLLETFPLVIRLEAIVYQGNEASERVLEKAGFELESRNKKAVEKFGEVLDSMTFCMFRP